MTSIRHINRQHIPKLIRDGEIVVSSQHGRKPTLEDFNLTTYDVVREIHDTHKKGEVYGKGRNERNNIGI